MSAPDISREAVERLAAELMATKADLATEIACAEAAATLRALLSERDAALAAVEVARREEREACATAAQRFAVSEGWSNTSALRLRNAIRALPIQPMPEQEAENG